MSAILAILHGDGHSPADEAAQRMLAAMRSRGADRSAVWSGEGALVASSRAAWEMGPGFADGILVLVEEDIVVAADAAIYYRDDLRRALEREGIVAAQDSASHLIAAAYRAWGDACAEHLEGDFAFLVWDRVARRVCAARDYSGKRPLFFAEFGRTLVIASTVGGALAHPDCPGDIDLAAVAQCAGGMFSASETTCFRAVRPVLAGWTLARVDGASARVRRHWSPPPMSPQNGLPFEEAAATLRALLERAVVERMPPRGEASIWLSGGWDSPAVLGAGQAALRALGDTRSILPVSMSYPPGDPGREDELIQVVADFWKVPVRWVDIRDVPFFDRPEEGAAAREDPFAHPFEMWNRLLARGSRDVGAHVALEGVGGDQLFQASEVYFADLLRTGRWPELVREWKAKGMSGTGFRNFFRWAVQPLLPSPLLDLAALLRGGRPLVGYLERHPPRWLDRDFVRRHELQERERVAVPPRRGGTCVAYETQWYLTNPYFPRVFGNVSAFALEEGVEIRSPLYDSRVIRFALTRPRWERTSGRETKRLLRAAVRGLLPDEILAPRPSRTGVTGGYFTRSMREQFPRLCKEITRSSVLASAGIIDAKEFERAASEYLRGATEEQVGVNLYFTLQAELWLRARISRAGSAASATYDGVAPSAVGSA